MTDQKKFVPKEEFVSQTRPKEFAFSCSVFMRTDVNSSGKSHIYLNIMLDRKRIRIPLNLHVDPDQFDRKKGKLKGSSKLANDYNAIIRNHIARANKILVDARLAEIYLTPSLFKTKYFHGLQGGSFILFAFRELHDRKVELEYETWKTHKGDLTKLKNFNADLHFSDLNYEVISNFDRHMIGVLQNKPNTRKKTLKTIRTYVRIAIKKGKMNSNPFDDYKVQGQKSDRTYLDSNELKALEELYDSENIDKTTKDTLQCFLFSCLVGGIRVGDVVHLDQTNIINGELVFIPKKTFGKSAKMVRIPITERAKKYINPKGKILPDISAQCMNRTLKYISSYCGIDKLLTFHVSRHTFATLFLKAGGKIEVLQDLLGHNSLKSTQQYIHVTNDSRKEQMEAMNNI